MCEKYDKLQITKNFILFSLFHVMYECRAWNNGRTSDIVRPKTENVRPK